MQDAPIPEKIFKSYDIRGEFGTQVTEKTAELIGRAYVRVLDAAAVAVGRDMRSHSPRLEDALVRGITAAGADAVRIGQCSTPMSYYAAATLDVDGAIMVTASHNPAKDNGFKFCKQGGQPMGLGTGLEEVRRLVLDGEAESIQAALPGGERSLDLLAPWCEHLKQYVDELRELKIVIDCGNGVMGPIARPLLGQIDPDGKLDIIWLFEEPDGTFPWHPADPLKPINIRHLQGAVLATEADLGIAFDGDGDRLAFVDERARFVGCDLVTALFARHLLSQPENKGKHVLCDLRSTRALPEAIEAAGGVPEIGRVGHSHIKAAMRGLREGRVRDESATGEIIFAGELSGHFYFRDCYVIDTSERALLLALSILAADSRPFSEQIAPLRKYWHSGEINFALPSDEARNGVLDQVRRTFSDQDIFELDGISVEADQWWLNVRPSNTEPVIRLTAESFRGPQELAELVDGIQDLVAKTGGTRL